MKRSLFVVIASIVLLCASERASTQTLFTVSGGAGTVFEHTGPPGPCGYPTGPLLSFFPFPGLLVCPLPAAFPFLPASIGDIACNRTADTVWVTDGLIIAEYSSVGVPLRSFPLPIGLALPGPV